MHIRPPPQGHVEGCGLPPIPGSTRRCWWLLSLSVNPAGFFSGSKAVDVIVEQCGEPGEASLQETEVVRAAQRRAAVQTLPRFLQEHAVVEALLERERVPDEFIRMSLRYRIGDMHRRPRSREATGSGHTGSESEPEPE